jgi:hypothetical protein
MKVTQEVISEAIIQRSRQHNRLWLSFFHLLARKSNLDKFSISADRHVYNIDLSSK